jgi:hypothetical protein
MKTMSGRRVEMSKFVRAACVSVFAFLATGSLSHADNIIARDALQGTIWMAETTHDRATINASGKLDVKEGKEIYVEFMELIDDVHVIKIHWWNTSNKINVVEYGVLVPGGENHFVYSEAQHAPGSGFPGIQGQGSFRLINDNTAQLTQIGHLIDGSASAFATDLKRVDKAPEVPIPQTYPPVQ